MYNESIKKASLKYMKNNTEEIKLRVQKSLRLKDIWKEAAARAGVSMTQYVTGIVNKQIKTDYPDLFPDNEESGA